VQQGIGRINTNLTAAEKALLKEEGVDHVWYTYNETPHETYTVSATPAALPVPTVP
jgi:hypothetical protein